MEVYCVFREETNELQNIFDNFFAAIEWAERMNKTHDPEDFVVDTWETIADNPV